MTQAQDARIIPTGRPPRIADTVNEALLVGVPCLELVLIRHGRQTLPGPSAARSERVDPPLSTVGRRQATLLGEELGGQRYAAVYASDLRRATETAAQVVGRAGTVTTLPGLREIEPFGELEKDQLLDTDVDFRGDFLRTRRFDSLPHTEGSSAFRARVRGTLRDVIATHPAGTVAVVCHGGVINAFLAELVGTPDDMFVTVAHASVSRVLVTEDRWALHGVNDTAHLRREDPALVTY